ncbi:unnamed protein product [Durusdinium trenchii]|uniref:Uncharacterized protein n=1 Tax=Durusdinium trenchii TaxID=1381693 RepID=A0ABP0NBW3_9DINO
MQTSALLGLSLWSLSTGFLLDVGAPRTGTQSMYDALKLLGFNPLHSGYKLKSRDAVCGYLFGGEPLDDALAVLDGYDAAMDEPFMLIYEEVLAAIPDAKFLLTISDPESWYENYNELVRLYWDTETDLAEGEPSYYATCLAMSSWGCKFFSSPFESDKKTCLDNYQRHIDRVQQVIPAEQLLVYNWSDGWAPLAHFLGVPIPEVEFPHTDAAIKALTYLNKTMHDDTTERALKDHDPGDEQVGIYMAFPAIGRVSGVNDLRGEALPADDLAVTAVQFEVLVTEISSSAAFVVSDALHGWLAESRLRALPKRSIAGLCSSCRKPLPQEAFTRGARRRLRSGAAAACEACNKEARRQGAFGLDSLGSSWLPAICTLVGGSLVSVYLRPSMPLSLAIGSMLAAFCLKSWLFGWLGLGREPSLETKALRLVGEGSTAWSRCVDDAWVRSFAHLRRGAFTTEQLQRWWDAALNETHWRQPMLPNGRLLPRSAAWFVQPGCSCSYEYNGTAWPAVEVPKWLQEVEDAVWHLLSDEGPVCTG